MTDVAGCVCFSFLTQLTCAEFPHARQLRLITPTTRPVGCLSETELLATCERTTLASRVIASSSSVSSPVSSASSFLSVADASQSCAKRGSARAAHTFLINDLIGGCLPFLAVEYFHDDDVTLNCSIHMFATNQKDRLRECLYGDTSLCSKPVSDRNGRQNATRLEIIILICVEMPLM